MAHRGQGSDAWTVATRRGLSAAIARLVGCFALLVVAAWPATHAEEVHKRFRLALLAGGDSSTEEIRSGSTNVLTLIDVDGAIDDRFNDPRDDAAVTGALEARSGALVTLSLQYALTPLFLLEGRVGYRSNDVGQIEVQEIQRQRVVRVPAGELERIPLSLNALWRFRPDSTFNPYVGAGLGYSIVDFAWSPELQALSDNLELARGRPTRLRPESQFNFIDVTISPPRPLRGAEVTTGSAFEWNLVGGAELSFGKRWATFVDLGYAFSGARWAVGFDGGEDLGVGVPNATAPVGSPLATRVRYGPMQTLIGGAVDLTGDGVADPGYYYIEGGRFRMDGFTFQFGLRYTF